MMALQNRCAMWGRSIVSNCYADGGNITTPQAEAQREAAWARAETDGPLAYEGVSSNPRDVAVAQWLRAGGIRRVITGHKPAGDSPAICSSGYTGVEVITADTSFSDTSKPDNRGAAIASVLVQGESAEANHTEIAGVLRDGREFSGHLATLVGDADGARLQLCSKSTALVRPPDAPGFGRVMYRYGGGSTDRYGRSGWRGRELVVQSQDRERRGRAVPAVPRVRADGRVQRQRRRRRQSAECHRSIASGEMLCTLTSSQPAPAAVGNTLTSLLQSEQTSCYKEP